MAKFLEVYKCALCGNIVEVVKAAGGTLSCCGEEMKHMVAGTSDGAKEKHIPEIEIKDNGILVKVGSVEHPMTEEHHIAWIELLADGETYIKFLKPNAKPEAFFPITPKNFKVREYCNLHGLWEKGV